MEKLSTIPEGLHSLEYSRHLLENSLAMPATRRNIELIAESITAVSKTKKLTLPMAYTYLERAVRLAKEQGIKVDYFFFESGTYTEVRPKTVDRYEKEKRQDAAYRAHGCHSGWIYKGDKVVRCPECIRGPIE